MGWTIPVQPTAYTPQIATDTTSRTVSAAAYTQLSGDFTVPANDAAAGSVYLIRCWGTFNNSGPTTLTTSTVLFGSTLPAAGMIFPANNPTTTGSYIIDTEIIVVTPGAAGSVSGLILWTGTSAPSALLAEFSGVTVNTTGSSIMGIQAKWAIGAASSITCVASVYERDGPGAVAQ